jgi:3-deoxy-D-manno-octulosonic-acid transferase
VEYAKPVIRELFSEFPSYDIVVTYSSPSFLKLFSPSENLPTKNASFKNLAMKNVSSKNREDSFGKTSVVTLPLPFDFSFLIKPFLKKYRIQAILIARSDLWPNLLLEAKKLHIPTHFFSVTQSQPFQNCSL